MNSSSHAVDSTLPNQLALMKVMASSVLNPTISVELISQKASGPMRTVLRTEDDRPVLTCRGGTSERYFGVWTRYQSEIGHYSHKYR